MDSYTGFLREDGGIGIRNHLLILPSVSCANDVTKKIAGQLPGAVAIIHQHGCGHLLDADIAQTRRTLVGNACNPNVGACLVVGLGCELLDSSDIAGEIRDISGKRVEYLRIQDHHGSVQSVAEGVGVARTLQKELLRRRRTAELHFSALTVGIAGNAVKGSTENRAIGVVTDALVALGATVIQGESSEFLFAEEMAMERCPDAANRTALEAVFARVRDRIRSLQAPLPETIGREKLEKMGISQFSEVVLYGQKPTGSGLIHMESPRFITETISGMTAAGAQIILASTPKGSAIASPIAPTLRVHEAKAVDGPNQCLRALFTVAKGEHSSMEAAGVNTFAIMRVGPST